MKPTTCMSISHYVSDLYLCYIWKGVYKVLIPEFPNHLENVTSNHIFSPFLSSNLKILLDKLCHAIFIINKSKNTVCQDLQKYKYH